MARDALASSATLRLMGMFADRSLQTCGVVFFLCVASEAERISGPDQVGRRIAVDLMAIEAAELTTVHRALNKVIALHAVIVRGQFGILVEVRCSRLHVFEFPVVSQPLPGQDRGLPPIRAGPV